MVLVDTHAFYKEMTQDESDEIILGPQGNKNSFYKVLNTGDKGLVYRF